MIKVRVRGIYSTALTKLLLDSQFQVVQPSTVQRERFDIIGDQEPHDLDIDDRPDHHGIHVLGKEHAIDALCDLLRAISPDVILRRWNVAVDGIYEGLLKRVDEERGAAFVDIGQAMGWLKIKESQNFNSEEIMVQVQRRRLGARKASLSTDIEIAGEYAVLIPERQIKISHRIRDHRSRDRLRELGEELGLDWGIIWRTAAADQSASVLTREVSELMERAQTIRARAEDVEAPAMLWGETYFMDVEFPALSKRRLDRIRNNVVPTINHHHFFKICGERTGSAVDMAEKLLEEGRSPGEVEESFERIVEAKLPTKGSTIDIEHVKLDGRIFNLGRGKILAFNRDNGSIKYHRDIKGSGFYDGLRTPKEEGDYAVTDAKIGEWYLTTKYFSKNKRFKGTYINLNTPIELCPCTLRYVDLEVDISIQPDGKISVLDVEKLEEKRREGYITKDLTERVRTKLKGLLDQVKDKSHS